MILGRARARRWSSTKGLHDVAQTGLTGLSLGAIYALGAVGLTLVYGILKLVNFAHGDFLTFGAYMAYLVNVTWGMPLVLGIFFAMATTALLGIFFEKVMWGPMRARGAGLLQLLLMSIGLAFLLRALFQYVWSTEIRFLDVNVIETVEVFGLRIGRTSLVVLIVGVVVIVGIGLMLRYTLLGKRMRALSDNLELAETSGIDTSRVILYTWLFAGALAGLAGVMAAATTELRPELGFELLLPIFAAVILGGIGDAFGALAGGLVLGLVIEWSTLFIEARWKVSIGFVALIIVLIVRPQGIFGRARDDLTAMDALPVAITFDFLTSVNFWTSVGVLAATYALVALGLQLNVGFTGIVNFGAAGFMAVGAYTMAILTIDTGISFWLSLPLSILVTMAFGLIVGLPSLRLRTDYLAIATIAFAEIIRLIAQNARELTGGNQGLFCSDDQSRLLRRHLARRLRHDRGLAGGPRLERPGDPLPAAARRLGAGARRHPWPAVRAAQPVGKGASRRARGRGRRQGAGEERRCLQAPVARHLRRDRGDRRLDPGAQPGDHPPDRLRAPGHLLRLRGAGAGRARELLGGAGRLGDLLDPARGNPLHRRVQDESDQVALRFAIVGLVLILLMAFRPQGMFGKREEMVLGD